MYKILLPTDFSENAWNAIFTAVKLFAKTKCHFYVLHAYEPRSMDNLGRKTRTRLGLIYDSLSKHSEQELQKIFWYLNKHHKNDNHIFEVVSKSATLDEAVEEMIASHDLNLIVMGTQGATGAKKVFLGSNTVKVLKKVKTLPVLVVPSGYDLQHLKRVVFPTDFSRRYELFQLRPLTELISLWEASLDILHVALDFELNDQQRKNREILVERLKELDIPHRFENIEFDANIARSIANYTSEQSFELMAMIRYHHGFWEKFIGEPVIKKVAFNTTVPVLMLPET